MAAQPAFAALRRSGEDAGQLLDQILQVTGLVALAAFVGMALVAEPLVSVILGAQWSTATPVLQAMCLVGFYLAVARTQNAFCLAAGRADGIARLAVWEMAIGAVLIPLAALVGPVWAGLAFTLRFYLLWPLRFGLVATLGGADGRAFLRGFAPGLAGLAMMALAVWAWVALAAPGLPAWATLAGGSALGAATLGGFVWLALPGRLAEARALLRR